MTSQPEETWHERFERIKPIAQKDWLDYLSIEKDLVELQHHISLDVINDNTVGPTVKKIVISSCSMIEVLLKREFSSNKRIKELMDDFVNPDNYKALALLNISVSLSSRVVLPFESFCNQYTDEGGRPCIRSLELPSWWKAYNSFKHDPVEDQTATLKNAIEALAALFIVIHGVDYTAVKSGVFDFHRSKIFAFPTSNRPADRMNLAPRFKVTELDEKFSYLG